ncbi:hypothetical protein [Isoptericola croceus]|uniref:hypothetical protein n=1 Tax=Isoptericola croceus TaxID=3031406 RepID=UPI0023F7BFB6|nr:hypothetical protein [Isoptericola croceus]
MMLRTGHAVACSVLLVSLTTAGCNSALTGSSDVLVYPGDGAGAVIPDATEGAPWTMADPTVCLKDPASSPVTITSVAPVEGSDGIEVTSFATGSPASEFGSDFVSLPDAGFDPLHTTVEGVCGDGHAELVLELVRTGTETGHSESFVVTYRDGDKEGRLHVPFEVTLCAPDDSTTEHCD